MVAQNCEPPLKRRRLSQSDDGPIKSTKEVEVAPVTLLDTSPHRHSPLQEVSEARSTIEPLLLKAQSTVPPLPRTIDRAVFPPVNRLSEKSRESQNGKFRHARENVSNGTPPPKSEKVSLTPRLLTPNPAPHSVRLAILKKIHEQIARLNDETQKDQAMKRELVLSQTEVIQKALDEEEKAGKESPQIYKNVVGHRIQHLKRMKVEEWTCSLLKTFQDKYSPSKKSATSKEKPFETGLSAKEEIEVLPHIYTPVKGLESHGYITVAPTVEEIKIAQQGVEAAAGYERCERCGTRFQVFPGRNTDEKSKYFGRLTSTEKGCTYHWAKLFRPPKSATAGGAEQESYHPCCGGGIGSKGCTEGTDHVFKVVEVKRLASVWQFKSTPRSKPSGLPLCQPVAFDCEMGYTTLGLELIRLTAVSWPDNHRLLDVLVRPLGEVIDYNTRFSGVSQEHFSNSIPSDAKAVDSETASAEEKKDPLPLRTVDSPMVARDLLFELLTPETPLIGHAIENDLNACRIIHPTIVDTALLFPHPRGLPIRYGLKMLTSKHLGRSIQTGSGGGGAITGHDSMEDAKATGDLVRFKVLEKWKKLKVQGWRFEEERLLPKGRDLE